MLTGKAAFAGETLTDIVAAVVKNEPDWDALPVATPGLVRSLLRRCLQKDPGRRLQHAGDARIEIDEAIAEPAVRPSTVGATRPRAWMRPMLPWALVALIAISFLSQMLVGRSGSAPSAVVRLDLIMPVGVELPTTASPNMALSTDRSRIAFVAATDGLRRVYVRRFDESEATALRGTELANICFFSPDGRTIGFVTSDRLLKKVSLADGLVTTFNTDVDHLSAGGVWDDNDRIVFARTGALWEMLATDAGSARQLTYLDQGKGERMHAWPVAVDGGRAILLTTITAGARMTMHIEALVRASGKRHVVVDSGSYPMYASSGHLVFFRDNALIAAPFDIKSLTLTGTPAVVVENIALDQLGAPLATLSTAGTLAYVNPGSATRPARLGLAAGRGIAHQRHAAPVSESSA
jgi:serine/threonine-protein kinase